MVTLTPDPTNPDKLILTAVVTLYLDRCLVESLSAEIESAIRAQAIRDLKNNPAVKKQIAEAATRRLLDILGVPTSLPSLSAAPVASLVASPPIAQEPITR